MLMATRHANQSSSIELNMCTNNPFLEAQPSLADSDRFPVSTQTQPLRTVPASPKENVLGPWHPVGKVPSVAVSTRILLILTPKTLSSGSRIPLVILADILKTCSLFRSLPEEKLLDDCRLLQPSRTSLLHFAYQACCFLGAYAVCQ